MRSALYGAAAVVVERSTTAAVVTHVLCLASQFWMLAQAAPRETSIIMRYNAIIALTEVWAIIMISRER